MLIQIASFAALLSDSQDCEMLDVFDLHTTHGNADHIHIYVESVNAHKPTLPSGHGDGSGHSLSCDSLGMSTVSSLRCFVVAVCVFSCALCKDCRILCACRQNSPKRESFQWIPLESPFHRPKFGRHKKDPISPIFHYTFSLRSL